MLQHMRLREFHRQRKRALLTFGGKCRRVEIVQLHRNVIAMRSQCR